MQAQRQGRETNSRSWAGFLGASRRWHQDALDRNMDEQPRQFLRWSGGEYDAWNSLLEAHSDRGMDVVPRTGAMALMEESLAMQHCVDSYWTNCRDGQSRIFSLLNDGEAVATGKIVLRGLRWEGRQVRAQQNREPGEAAKGVMSGVAERYSQAWTGLEEEPDRRHRSWKEKAAVYPAPEREPEPYPWDNGLPF